MQTVLTLENIHTFAQEIALLCQKKFGTVVYLHGDLGVGKTTLTSSIMRAFGLPKTVPVLSPTFPYIQIYDIKGEKFAHLDLYRMDSVNETALYSILDDPGIYKAIFIEWPERLQNDANLPCDFHVSIAIDSEQKRIVKIT